MQTVKLNKENAIQEFNNGNNDVKKSLKNIFGESFFMPVIGRIKTYEDACNELDKDPLEELPYNQPVNARQEAANAFVMLDIITEALLEGGTLDWENSNQQKWYPWFNNYSSGAGFRFDGTGCNWSVSFAFGGARLCVDTQEKAKYLGTQFIDIWNKFLNPNK